MKTLNPTHERVLGYIKSNPYCTSKELVHGLQLKAATVHASVQLLRKRGDVNAEQRGRRCKLRLLVPQLNAQQSLPRAETSTRDALLENLERAIEAIVDFKIGAEREALLKRIKDLEGTAEARKFLGNVL